MALGRQDQLSPDCARETGLIDLVIDAGEVTYYRSDVAGQSACQGQVFPEQNVLMDGYDTVEVGEGGRAQLTRESAPLITIYQNSTVTLAAEPEAASESAFQLHIASGAVMVGRPGEDLLPGLQDPAGITPTPDPGQESHAGLVIVTASATFQGNDAAYFLYASPDGIAWLAVTEGQVEVTTTTGDVTVAGGWQTRTGEGESTMIPLPATRSVVDLAYGGDLPGISQLTGDALTDADVFATCRVSSLTGSDIRNDAGMAGAVVRHLGFGSEFGASYRASDNAWVRGETLDDLAGWVESGNIICPYDIALLPANEELDTAAVVATERPAPTETTSSDRDADGVSDDADNCPDTANADQLDRDEDDVGDRCDLQPVAREDLDPDDIDGDEVSDVIDNCPFYENADQADTDMDGVGDPCDDIPAGASAAAPDSDGDTWPDDIDNCWFYNPEQTDANLNGLGDECDEAPTEVPFTDPDSDGDTWPDNADNCPLDYNPEQEDEDGDGVGDWCDDSPFAQVSPTNPRSVSTRTRVDAVM